MRKSVLNGIIIGVLAGIILLAIALCAEKTMQSFIEAGVTNQVGSVLLFLILAGSLGGAFGWYLRINTSA